MRAKGLGIPPRPGLAIRLRRAAISTMVSFQEQPQRVQNYFQNEDVSYAAA
jgi:hypothetical protein